MSGAIHFYTSFLFVYEIMKDEQKILRKNLKQILFFVKESQKETLKLLVTKKEVEEIKLNLKTLNELYKWLVSVELNYFLRRF